MATVRKVIAELRDMARKLEELYSCEDEDMDEDFKARGTHMPEADVLQAILDGDSDEEIDEL